MCRCGTRGARREPLVHVDLQKNVFRGTRVRYSKQQEEKSGRKPHLQQIDSAIRRVDVRRRRLGLDRRHHRGRAVPRAARRVASAVRRAARPPSTRFAYAVFLLNKDLEQLLNAHGLLAVGPRHTLQNSKRLFAARKKIVAADFAHMLLRA